jgi:hypothetical protein
MLASNGQNMSCNHCKTNAQIPAHYAALVKCLVDSFSCGRLHSKVDHPVRDVVVAERVTPLPTPKNLGIDGGAREGQRQSVIAQSDQ